MRSTILVFIMFLSNLAIHAEDYKARYNLHFNNSASTQAWAAYYPYTQSTHNGIIPYKGDTIGAIIFLSNPIVDRLNYELTQRISLPATACKEVKVVLNCAGQQIETVGMGIAGLDQEEKTLHSNHIQFVPDSIVSSFQCQLNSEDAKVLRIAIWVKGKKNCNAMLLLHSMDILLDGKSIAGSEVDIEPLTNNELSPKQVVVAEDYLFPTGLLANDKRIIALGTTLQKHELSTELVFKNMLQAVRKKMCNVLMWDDFMDVALPIEYYITQSEYTLKPWVRETYSDIMPWVDRLRTHNLRLPVEQRTHLFAIGSTWMNSSTQNIPSSLLDFYISLPNWNKQDFALPFLQALAQNKAETAIQELYTHKEQFKEWIGDPVIKITRRALSLYHQHKEELANPMVCDSIMAENVRYFVNEFPSNSYWITANAHKISHSLDAITHRSKPMGYFLRQWYKNDYQNTVITIKNDTKRDIPYGSYEALCNNIGSKCWIIPTDSIHRAWGLLRIMGKQDTPSPYFLLNINANYDNWIVLKDRIRTTDNSPQDVQKKSMIQCVKYREEAIKQILRR